MEDLRPINKANRGEGRDQANVEQLGKVPSPPTDYGQQLRGKLLLRRDVLRRELSEINQCLEILDNDETVQKVFTVMSVANR